MLKESERPCGDITISAPISYQVPWWISNFISPVFISRPNATATFYTDTAEALFWSEIPRLKLGALSKKSWISICRLAIVDSAAYLWSMGRDILGESHWKGLATTRSQRPPVIFKRDGVPGLVAGCSPSTEVF
jgi:hypothetical protein